jgi:hypothetical protein
MTLKTFQSTSIGNILTFENFKNTKLYVITKLNVYDYIKISSQFQNI